MPVNPRSILNLLEDRLRAFTAIGSATQAAIKLVDVIEVLAFEYRKLHKKDQVRRIRRSDDWEPAMCYRATKED
ncbi:hypothetical protein RvY_16649 [Ramazzottius varieornatus]|uniref:Uncharacterized protein n=1 Tax=Ramazzottius varieornatus TaxID=947166 RepID=A0A1D1W5J5_RAMVA|nr:hypothetical protein RvY_16649 [Ramazzottius varieornatus]